MKRIPVTSSNIRTVGYDGARKTLQIEFANGAVWAYEDVPVKTYEDLLQSDSIGSFVANQIKANHVGVKVDAEDKA